MLATLIKDVHILVEMGSLKDINSKALKDTESHKKC